MSKLLVAAGLLLVLVAACGETGKPSPGYGDPCDTPMSGALGCPAVSTQPTQVTTIPAACHKLVECGVLARSYMQNVGTDCPDSSKCNQAEGGECLVTPKGTTQCHQPVLDHAWCVRALTQPGTDPCAGTHFTTEHVQAAIACIDATPCASLGLPFSAKRLPVTATPPAQARPTMDKYTCADGKIIWTSTICDFGLLYYETHGP